MHLSRRTFMRGTAGLALGATAFGRPALAGAPTVRIGVLADFSGIYNDLLGMGGVGCVRQAIADFNPQSKGFNVDVVYADHINKADVGANIVRKWYDADGIDMMIAGPNSAVGLAASFLTREKDKVCIGVAVTTSDFTGKQCTPNSINWTYDAYMLSKSVAIETVRNGGKGGTSWRATTHSASPYRARRRLSSSRPAARSSATPDARSAPRTFPPCCCPPRRAVPTFWALPSAATTCQIASSRRTTSVCAAR